MAGGFYLPDGLSNATPIGMTTASTTLTTVTSTTSNTKAAYVQLTASTAFDATGIMVIIDNALVNNVSFDIAIGAAASEKIVIADVRAGAANTAFNALAMFPVMIPAGSRIAARCQSDTATVACKLAVMLFDNSMMGRSGGVVDAVGFVSASTLGTTIDCGATANTKSAYVQITASTAVDYAGFCINYDGNNQVYTAGATFMLDVAIGAGGSEQIILSNLFMRMVGGGAPLPVYTSWFDMPIRAGTRIAVRAQSSSNTAITRVFGFTLYGLRG